VFLKVTYCVEFFEPEYPGSVALKGPKATDMTEFKREYHETALHRDYITMTEDDTDYGEDDKMKEPIFFRRIPNAVVDVSDSGSSEDQQHGLETPSERIGHRETGQQVGDLDTPARSRPSVFRNRSKEKRTDPLESKVNELSRIVNEFFKKLSRTDFHQGLDPQKDVVITSNFPLAASCDKQLRSGFT